MPTPTFDAVAATVRVGRRPIHDRDRQVVAHELVPDPSTLPADADARGELFVAGMVDVGLQRLSAGMDVVVALPTTLLRDGALAHLPLDRLVLDIAADHEADDEVEAQLRSADASGLRLRVADPIANPHLASLAEVAHQVAVEVSPLAPGLRRERLARLRHGGSGTVVAVGVDDHAIHDDCRDAGYELFSGDVLSVPEVVSGRRLGNDRLALLRLVSLLDEPMARVDDLDRAVSANPALAYQVLRYVNSAHVGLRTRIDSVRAAIVMVGPPVLRQLAGLLLALEAADKPAEAARVALCRAEACAMLGLALGDRDAVYRTVGLLSAVDLLMDVPLADALVDLPLHPEVTDAVLHHHGPLGRVLHAIRCYERCDWDDPVLGEFDQHLLAEAYFSGIARAEELLALVHRL